MSSPSPPFAWIVFYSNDGSSVYFYQAPNGKIGPFAVPRQARVRESRIIPTFLGGEPFKLNEDTYSQSPPGGQWAGAAVHAIILKAEITGANVRKISRATKYPSIPATDLIDELTFRGVVALSDSVAPTGNAVQQGLPPSPSGAGKKPPAPTFKLDPGYIKVGDIAVIVLDLARQRIVLQLENQDRNYGVPVVRGVTSQETPVDIVRRALGIDAQADVSLLQPNFFEVEGSYTATYPGTTMAYVYGYVPFPDSLLSAASKQKLVPYDYVIDPNELAKKKLSFPNAATVEQLANAILQTYGWQSGSSVLFSTGNDGSSGSSSSAGAAGLVTVKTAPAASPKIVPYVPPLPAGDALRQDLSQDHRSRLVLTVNDLWSMKTVDGADLHLAKTTTHDQISSYLFVHLGQALWETSINAAATGDWHDQLNTALYRMANGWPTDLEPHDMTAAMAAGMPADISSHTIRAGAMPDNDEQKKLVLQLLGRYGMSRLEDNIVADLRKMSVIKHVGQYDSGASEINLDADDDSEHLSRHLTHLARQLNVSINLFYSLESDGPGIHSVQFQSNGEEPIQSRLRTCADAMIMRGRVVSIYLVEVDKNTVFVGHLDQ